MATNEWAFTVLVTAVTVVDDTALVSKVVINELKVCSGECSRALKAFHGRCSQGQSGKQLF